MHECAILQFDTVCLAALEKTVQRLIPRGYVLTSLDSLFLRLTYCGSGATLGQAYIESFCQLFRDSEEPRKG